MVMKYIKKYVLPILLIFISISLVFLALKIRRDITRENEEISRLENSSNKIIELINCKVELLDESSEEAVDNCEKVEDEQVNVNLDYELLLNIYEDFVSTSLELEKRIDQFNEIKFDLTVTERDDEIISIAEDLEKLNDIKKDLETTTNIIKSE